MEAMKIALVAIAGLGSTWVARAATEALFGVRPPPIVMQAAPAADAGQPAGAAQQATPAVTEMSREEMEAELKRAQKDLGTPGKEDELREFRPTKPLPADLPVALPSDI